MLNFFRRLFGRKSKPEKKEAYEVVIEDLASITPKEEKLEEKVKEEKTDPDIPAVEVIKLKQWIGLEFQPYTWEQVGIILYKEFMDYGKPFPDLKENDVLPPKLILAIDKALKLFHNKGLPIDKFK